MPLEPVKELDLEREIPFPRYSPRDEWIKFRVSVDSDEEGVEWGG